VEATGRRVGVTKNGCKGEKMLLDWNLQTATLNKSTASIEMKADLALPSNPPLLSRGNHSQKNWSKKP
jgi:hypothetical protein